MDELKKMGFVTDFAPIKIKEGWGDTICNVLNSLCDYALEKRGFKFGKPAHKASKQKIENRNDEDDEEEILPDESMVDDEETDEVLDAFGGGDESGIAPEYGTVL